MGTYGAAIRRRFLFYISTIFSHPNIKFGFTGIYNIKCSYRSNAYRRNQKLWARTLDMSTRAGLPVTVVRKITRFLLEKTRTEHKEYAHNDRSYNPWFHFDQRCNSLLLTQQARVRFLNRSVSWLRFFRGFPSTVRQMSGNLGHIRPRVPSVHHISSKPYSSVYGRFLILIERFGGI